MIGRVVEARRGDPEFVSGISIPSERVLRPSYSEAEAPGHAISVPASTVLLVDDNPHHRIPLLRALRDHGYNVLHAAGGPSGETLFGASRFEIDALVACAQMKRMCGFELAHRVRRLRPEVQVLLMWRQVEGPEDFDRAYERGYGMIEEPYSPEELCRQLTGLLRSPINDTCEEPRLDG